MASWESDLQVAPGTFTDFCAGVVVVFSTGAALIEYECTVTSDW
jgi:hypothetical protein